MLRLADSRISSATSPMAMWDRLADPYSANRTLVPIHCQVAADLTDFDGSWTLFESTSLAFRTFCRSLSFQPCYESEWGCSVPVILQVRHRD